MFLLHKSIIAIFNFILVTFTSSSSILLSQECKEFVLQILNSLENLVTSNKVKDREITMKTMILFFWSPKATAPKLDETSFASMVERQKEVLRREAEERQRTAQGLPSRPPSTSSSQVQPQSNAATREDSNDAAGPAPQNTATPVDAAASPAPMQVS